MSRYSRYDPDDDSVLGDMAPMIWACIVVLTLVFFSGLVDRQQVKTNQAVYVLKVHVEQYAQLHNGCYPLTAEITKTLPDAVRIHLRCNPYRPWKPIMINAADVNNGDLSYASDGTSYEILGYGGQRLARAASDSLVY